MSVYAPLGVAGSRSGQPLSMKKPESAAPWSPKPGVVTIRTGLALHAGAEHDQVRPRLAQVGVGQPPAGHDARGEAVDHDVRPLEDRASSEVAASRVGHVDGDAQLVGIELGEKADCG